MKKLTVLATIFIALVVISTARAESDLSVTEASIATGMEGLTPEGVAESFSNDVGRLLCYSKITGGSEDDSIVHRWYYGDKLMAEVGLAVKAESWRTYSSKNILPFWTGRWRVEIADSEGTLLEILEFTVE